MGDGRGVGLREFVCSFFFLAVARGEGCEEEEKDKSDADLTEKKVEGPLRVYIPGIERPMGAKST